MTIPKQRAPVLPKELEPRSLASLDGVDLEQVRIEGCALAGQRGRRMRLETVRLSRCSFAESKLTELSWMDVECAGTDLSLVDWPRPRLTRVVLADCRATGARWNEAEFEDVRFAGCQLECAAFAKARFRRVTFERCRLRDVDFSGADLSGTVFDGCEMPGVDFTGAKLAGADVHTSELREVRLDAKEMRGLVVSRDQAVGLVKLLGLVVKDG